MAFLVDAVRVSTADYLSAFRRELLDGGHSLDEAAELVRIAASALILECGLGVHDAGGRADG